jgi:hypothetical protein
MKTSVSREQPVILAQEIVEECGRVDRAPNAVVVELPTEGQTRKPLEDLMSDTRRRTLQLIAGRKSSGEHVIEEVLVDETDNPRVYRLVATPGLVLGVAAGDILDIDIDAGTFEIVSRGGNISVQIYGPHDRADVVRPQIASIGGYLDGRSNGLTIYTVPASAGFDKLERILNSAISENPQLEWYYGNVYDPTDGITPLNWWRNP